MRRIGSLLMSTVLVAGCASPAVNNQSLSVFLEKSGQAQPKLSPYDQGKRHLQFGSPGLAVDAFQTALRQNPDSIEALNGLAVAYDRLGRTDVAQRFLDRALALDPYSAVTLNNLAYLNLVQGNTAVALAYADRAKIAAALPMDMMLPDTIANAVDRTAAIATQLATNDAKERPVVAPILPPESDIKRVGLNEWELRIRPPNPADSVRINLPARDVAPRVIDSMSMPVVPGPVMEPLTEAVMAGVPDSVMADLIVPPSEPVAPAETVVASLPEPAAPAPAELAVIASPDTAVADPVAPPAPPVEAVTTLPPAVPVEPPVSLPIPESVATLRDPPVSDAIVASPVVAPEVTPVPLAAPAAAPVQPLPEPALPEPIIASLPASAPAPLPAPMAEPVAVRELVIASLAVPQPAPQQQPTLPQPMPSVTPTAPTAQLVAPMVASLAPAASPRPFAAPRSRFTDFRWRANVPSATRVRVSNGTGRRLMASRFSQYFAAHGLFAHRVGDANNFNYERTVIFYNPDQREQAFALASILPFPYRLAEARQGRGQIELILGKDLLGVDDSLGSS